MTSLRKTTLALLLWAAACGAQDDLLRESPLYVLDVPGVSKVALHRNRAFIIVPEAEVPLQEASWLPHVQHVSKMRKPPVNASVRRCQGLVRPVDLQVDAYKRLWVLDAGDAKCAAKLIVYDIMRNRLVENARHAFQLGVHVQHLAVELGSSRGAAMAYVAGHDKIFAYSYYHDRSWPIKTIIDKEITDLAVNQSGPNSRATLLVLVNKEIVYQIYTSSVSEKKESGVLEIGSLMGPSEAGLISDGRGGVIYMLSRDFVAVKWNTNVALQAENQDILFQSDKVLYNVTSFVIDSNRNVWGVVNNGTNAMTWCAKLTLTGV